MNYNTLEKWIKENYSDQEIKNVSCLYNGVINNTYLVSLSNKEKIVLKSSNSYDVGSIMRLRWQYDVQSDLRNVFPVPKVFKYCSEKSIIGNPFYIMEYIDGESKYDFNSVEKSFDLLDKLHRINPSDLTGKKYKKNTTMEEIINKTYSQYKLVETNKDLNFEYIFNWLKKSLPKETVVCFCHNDWRLSNILFSNNGDTISVIDWELSDIGDPRADLGIAMAYWFEGSDHNINRISPEPSVSFDNIYKEYFAKTYFERSGFDFSDWKFFKVFGLFRLITVGQLGGYRYRSGIIDNVVYNDIDNKVRVLINKCKKIIGEVDG